MSNATAPRRTLPLALAGLAATLLLGGCASIPERAWVNGRAMGQQAPLQYRNLNDMSGMRATYYRADPISALHRSDRPYQPFKRWR